MGGDSTNDTSGGTSGIKLTTVTNPYANSTIRVLQPPPDESRPVAHAAETAAIANASKVTKVKRTIYAHLSPAVDCCIICILYISCLNFRYQILP